jgi:hypothetical protein
MSDNRRMASVFWGAGKGTTRCYACEKAIHVEWEAVATEPLGPSEPGVSGSLQTARCPACGQLLVRLSVLSSTAGQLARGEIYLFPESRPRRAAPEVDDSFARDFGEACLLVTASPRASAALGRRLLQRIIREKAGIKRRDLSQEIDALIETNALAPDLAHDLDALRAVGNFAAHPIKSTSTGEIVEVEEGEAQWIVELLDELLDFYFVRPARRADKRDALNTKLADAGKPTLKGSETP